ncbi:MAG TPA: hypothetical protein VN634_19555 [Candidatus Limnocylindrales bacterium]|nr:hypothetical protein [Candidatus Limnocylindrales bacterium]
MKSVSIILSGVVLASLPAAKAFAAFSASGCQITQAEPVCVCVSAKGKHGKTFECDDPKLGPKCTGKGGVIKHLLEGDDPTNPLTIVCGASNAACDGPFTCPAPVDGAHQTICGQLYDLEDSSKFQAAGATGTACTTTTVDGPCSLDIVAYDAVGFGTNPATAPALTSGAVFIDDCGRYRVPDVAIPSGAFIELAIDDADVAKHGPTGSTNTVTVTTPKQAGAATPNFDAWVASKATTDTWELSGAPPVSGGLFVPIFHAMISKTNRDLQDGVTFTASGSPVPARDSYFVATEASRDTIDPTANSTGINGTVLVTGASLSDGPIYSGSGGGLSSSCVWETHGGTSLPSILSVQDFRPQNAVSETCDR